VPANGSGGRALGGPLNLAALLYSGTLLHRATLRVIAARLYLATLRGTAAWLYRTTASLTLATLSAWNVADGIRGWIGAE
jgi:hypothetical protein